MNFYIPRFLQLFCFSELTRCNMIQQLQPRTDHCPEKSLANSDVFPSPHFITWILVLARMFQSITLIWYQKLYVVKYLQAVLSKEFPNHWIAFESKEKICLIRNWLNIPETIRCILDKFKLTARVQKNKTPLYLQILLYFIFCLNAILMHWVANRYLCF